MVVPQPTVFDCAQKVCCFHYPSHFKHPVAKATCIIPTESIPLRLMECDSRLIFSSSRSQSHLKGGVSCEHETRERGKERAINVNVVGFKFIRGFTANVSQVLTHVCSIIV